MGKFNPYHDPSNGQFTTAAGTSGQDEAHVQLAAETAAGKYSVNLQEEEKNGGHTIGRHVNRSDAALMAEAQIPYKQTFWDTIYQAKGSFLSLSSANDFVNRVLERNAGLVDAVASGALDSQWLEERFGYPTGKEALVSDESLEPRIRPTYNVGVQILHDSLSPRGYRVLTAYPLNDIPGEDRL